ncbi:MAG: hypothetical protein R6V56_07415 [Lentisphaeria bacterium]
MAKFIENKHFTLDDGHSVVITGLGALAATRTFAGIPHRFRNCNLISFSKIRFDKQMIIGLLNITVEKPGFVTALSKSGGQVDRECCFPSAAACARPRTSRSCSISAWRLDLFLKNCDCFVFRPASVFGARRHRAHIDLVRDRMAASSPAVSGHRPANCEMQDFASRWSVVSVQETVICAEHRTLNTDISSRKSYFARV